MFLASGDCTELRYSTCTIMLMVWQSFQSLVRDVFIIIPRTPSDATIHLPSIRIVHIHSSSPSFMILLDQYTSSEPM